MDRRGVLVKTLLFSTHMVVQPFPVPTRIFLASDGYHLIVNTAIEQKNGVVVSNIHEVLPDSNLSTMSSAATLSCLLSGKFLPEAK
jgi:hypothetical protein